jgi:hypothetical protein
LFEPVKGDFHFVQGKLTMKRLRLQTNLCKISRSRKIPARSHEIPDASREILTRSRKVCASPAKCWTPPAKS